MKSIVFGVLVVTLLSLSYGIFTAAAEEAITYTPPKLGMPTVRVGAGTRTIGGNADVLLALVPEHAGLTSKTQPAICWYMSKPRKAKLEIRALTSEATAPVLDKEIAKPARGGIYCANLKDSGVTLEKKAEYKWLISAIDEKGQISKGIYGGGNIIVTEPSDEFIKKISEAKDTQVPFVSASSGYWYDAVESVSELITKHPKDKNLRGIRASLLQQVGLEQAAASDKKTSKR
ncbi:MAG: DUF928 domain-containing protein [Nitrospirae bacterium]|nr:DUF928 domain-containing protein [Nitrospirota bacterium]MBF0534452.1 DUF928 domain-containing protein [Nitrospirota bacterium]MBF0617078.1 DUF928 domain-containing protein [Nitrospirota bacterium]